MGHSQTAVYNQVGGGSMILHTFTYVTKLLTRGRAQRRHIFFYLSKIIKCSRPALSTSGQFSIENEQNIDMYLILYNKRPTVNSLIET